MSNILESFNKLNSNIEKLKPKRQVNIVAVSKTFTIDHIKPLIDSGHDHFGENKVQEAVSKWSDIKKANQNIKLHMIGKLQSNKAKEAIKLFDNIHSLDNQKLADVLSKHQKNFNKDLEDKFTRKFHRDLFCLTKNKNSKITKRLVFFSKKHCQK